MESPGCARGRRPRGRRERSSAPLRKNERQASERGPRYVVAQLGVQSDGASVRCDDSATLSAIRRAITTAESNAAEEHSLLRRPAAAFAGRAPGTRVIGLAN